MYSSMYIIVAKRHHESLIIRGHGDIKCILDTLWIQRKITDI